MSILSVALSIAALPLCLVQGLSMPARAESGKVLPTGAGTVYAGLGLHTWSKLRYADGQGAADGTLNRVMKPRLDLYGAVTPVKRLQLSAWAPLVGSFAVSDDSPSNPCPDAGPEGFCDPVWTVGEVGVQARYGLSAGPLSVSPALAIVADPWNAATRMRYTAVGDGTVDLVPGLMAEVSGDLGPVGLGLVGGGHYAWHVLRRTVETGSAGPFAAPGDDLSWLCEVQLRPPGPVSATLGWDGVQRLWGLDWEGSYYSEYWSTDERWTTLWYAHQRLYGKLSVALSDRMGLHAQAGRVVAVRNGPPDAWDMGLGWHLYMPPKGG